MSQKYFIALICIVMVNFFWIVGSAWAGFKEPIQGDLTERLYIRAMKNGKVRFRFCQKEKCRTLLNREFTFDEIEAKQKLYKGNGPVQQVLTDGGFNARSFLKTNVDIIDDEWDEIYFPIRLIKGNTNDMTLAFCSLAAVKNLLKSKDIEQVTGLYDIPEIPDPSHCGGSPSQFPRCNPGTSDFKDFISEVEKLLIKK